MFCLESTLVAERKRRYQVETQYVALVKQWNDLTKLINSKGGQQFLDSNPVTGASPVTGFSNDDINKMIRLCHPDKHANSEMSNYITSILNGLKKK